MLLVVGKFMPPPQYFYILIPVPLNMLPYRVDFTNVIKGEDFAMEGNYPALPRAQPNRIDPLNWRIFSGSAQNEKQSERCSIVAFKGRRRGP